MPVLQTKERILEAAATLMWEKSFHSVGLNEILRAVGVPKGSFYHYFQSKEHFGVELLKYYIAEATEEKTRTLLTDEIVADPLERLLFHLESTITTFEENGGKCPCLVLKLASEVTSLSEAMREVLAQGMPVWMGILGSVFDEAITTGKLAASVDSAAEAALLRDLWAGAIQRSTISQSPEPMKQALVYLKSHFRVLQDSPDTAKTIAN